MLSLVLVTLRGSVSARDGGSALALRAVESQEVASPAFGTRIKFELLGSSRNGSTGLPRSDTSDNLAPGEEAARTLFAGVPGRADLCEIGSLAEADGREAFYLWDLRVRVIGVTATETTLDLSWRRSRPDGEEPAVGEDGRIVSLEAGSPRVLDFVRALDPRANCSNLVLQVRADPLPRPGPQPSLVYDVWLVAKGPGQNRSIHQSAEAPSGQPVPLRLEGLTWSPDGKLLESTPSTPAVRVTATGTLVGTLAPDGSVAVSVRLSRSVSWGATHLRGEGRVEFRSGVGETISLALPTPNGRGITSMAERPTVVRGAPSASNAATIDFARVFRGTEFSLYIRVTQRGQ